jgi:hypothetical protein
VDGADGGFAAAVGDVTGHCARTLPPSLSVDVPAATPSAAQGGGAAGAATLRVMLGSDPLDEFDRAYWPMVLPHLFPYGTGAPPPGMHVNVWAGALLQRDPRRFALDKEFLFVAASQHLRHAWQRRAGLMVTAQGARVRQLAGLTASDVSDAFKVLTGTKRRAAASEGARALCSAVHGVNARIPGTPFAKARLYPRILAGIMRYGPIAYMVNFNPADIDHPLRCVRHCPSPGAFRDFHLHATCLFVCIDLRASPSSPPPFRPRRLKFEGHGGTHDRIVTIDVGLSLSARFKRISANPVAGVRFFTAFMRAYERCFLRFDHRTRQYANTPVAEAGGDRRSAFGTVKAHHNTIETNMRGTAASPPSLVPISPRIHSGQTRASVTLALSATVVSRNSGARGSGGSEGSVGAPALSTLSSVLRTATHAWPGVVSRGQRVHL